MISIIILTYNNLALTKKCLATLSKNTPKKHLDDVIVVDNDSSDETPTFLKGQEGINPILNKENVGFSKGNNIGAKKAKGNLLIFLNNDTEVQENWLEPIIKIFDHDEKVGAVGVKLLFPEGLVQHAGVVLSEDHIPRNLYRGEEAVKSYVNKQREFKAVTAACIAVKKEVFEQIGGFDEEYLNGLEDVDLCLRIKKNGYKIFYTPESTVIHHESVAPDRFKFNANNYKIFRNNWGNETPDEHKYLAEDGFNKIQILWHDLKSMAYNNGQYAQTPLRIKILKVFYIPLQKLFIVCKLIITLDFKTLNRKIKRAVNHG
ncbi:MAG: glycosyltransferase family 2 protein [Patescibacteria group bacterium]|nr:glycosyltransferase family 2 protein [Patescibacteria group bacterium]